MKFWQEGRENNSCPSMQQQMWHTQTNHALSRKNEKWDFMVSDRAEKNLSNEPEESLPAHFWSVLQWFVIKKLSFSKNKNSEETALESSTAILSVKMNFNQKIKYTKVQAISKWHKAEFFCSTLKHMNSTRGINHKQQFLANIEIAPLVIWVVLCSSYSRLDAKESLWVAIFGTTTKRWWILLIT